MLAAPSLFNPIKSNYPQGTYYSEVPILSPTFIPYYPPFPYPPLCFYPFCSQFRINCLTFHSSIFQYRYGTFMLGDDSRLVLHSYLGFYLRFASVPLAVIVSILSLSFPIKYFVFYNSIKDLIK